MKKIYYAALSYVVLGLAFGVFYREFTVYHSYDGITQLAFLHTHTLVLGGLFLILLIVLNQVFNISSYKRFNIWFILYNIGLCGLLMTMLIRGIGQVLSWELNGFNHVAGLFHTIFGITFVWFMVILGKRIDFKKVKQ